MHSKRLVFIVLLNILIWAALYKPHQTTRYIQPSPIKICNIDKVLAITDLNIIALKYQHPYLNLTLNAAYPQYLNWLKKLSSCHLYFKKASFETIAYNTSSSNIYAKVELIWPA